MTTSQLEIRFEIPSDRDAIQSVNRLAFGRDDEARLVDNLRDLGSVAISLVAVKGEQVVGHILFCNLTVQTAQGSVSALGLAPLSVLPASQRQGIGSELVRRGLEICRSAGRPFVIVLGHPEFYSRFGFSAEAARPLLSPFEGEAWQAMELQPGALTGMAGTVEYPAPFGLL